MKKSKTRSGTRKLLLLIGAMCLMVSAAFAQGRTVQGTITDGSGVGIPGVNIRIKGTSLGASTDLDGKYTLSGVEDGNVLEITAIGFKPQEVQVGSRSVIDLQLEADVLGLEEVVVVGYGSQKKSLVTGAISSIDADELAESRALRVEQALQGKSAGTIVMSNSGQPGDNFTIRIRGVGTNGNPDPLFIVDGVPLSKEALDYLNPSDVESMEILKDAAAGAIYGARAANGVVLITTKTGKKGRMQVTYDGYYGVQEPWRKLDLLNAEEYITVMNAQALNAGRPAIFSPNAPGYRNLDSLRWDTDWQDQMFYSGAPKTSHTLSFSGGNDNTTYSSSLSYYDQEGIVAKGFSDFERVTYRLNVDQSFGKLTLGTRTTFTHIEKRGISPNDFFAGNSLGQAMNMAPVVPVRMPDGTFGTPQTFGIPMQEITNPLGIFDVTNQNTNVDKVIASLRADYDLMDNLKLTVNYGTEYAFVNGNSYTPAYELDATHRNAISSVTRSLDRYVRWNLDAYATYNTNFGNHSLTAVAGTTAFKEESESLGATKQDLIFDDFGRAYLDNARSTEATAYGGYNLHTIRSYFGRANYSYQEKYIATAVLRADGSSRFGPANKFGFFPAVSAGWVASAESFWPAALPVSYFKLRASWGQTGNDNIGDFRYTTLLNSGLITFFGPDETQINGVAATQVPNPSLKWETSEQLDIGFDTRILNDQVAITFDWYNKTTKDWLVTAPIVPSAGSGAPTINGGTVRNTGLELEMSHFRTIGELELDLSFTGAWMRNTVMSINNTGQELLGGSGGFGQNAILRATPGQPLGYFYGYQTDGIFQNQTEVENHTGPDGNLLQPNAVPGDFRFRDRNNDGNIDDADRTMLGSPYPDFTLGLNIGLDWKGFDVSTFLYAALGQQIWNGTRRYDVTYANFTTEALNAWNGEGTSNTFPRLTEVDDNGNWSRPSDFFVEDADFLRMRNLTVGYTLPKDLLANLGINKVRVYFTGENLFTATTYSGYEPEIGGTPFQIGVDKGIYPNARVYLGGMSIQF